MPYASVQDARDDILTFFKTAWDAQTAPVPPVVYDNIAGEHPADGSAWLRVSVQHGESYQATVGGDPGNRRFRNPGMFVAQIFTPTGAGTALADMYAQILKATFEGQRTKGDGAFFYNVRSKEIGQNDNWWQVNFTAEFQWDEVR
jgi:hypothetical protein